MPRKVKIEPEKLDELMDVKPVRVLLEVNNTVINSGGDTIDEAIMSIKPVWWKTRTHLIVFKDGKETDLYLNVPRMRRLFGNDVFRRIIIGQLERRLAF